MGDQTTEKDQPCPVPECSDGYVRVAVLVQRRNYGHTETFARMDDVQCDECGGMGRVPRTTFSPGATS